MNALRNVENTSTESARWAARELYIGHHGALNAYSEDLRKKIVQALRRGAGKSDSARSFGSS